MGLNRAVPPDRPAPQILTRQNLTPRRMTSSDRFGKKNLIPSRVYTYCTNDHTDHCICEKSTVHIFVGCFIFDPVLHIVASDGFRSLKRRFFRCARIGFRSQPCNDISIPNLVYSDRNLFPIPRLDEVYSGAIFRVCAVCYTVP